MQNSYLRWFEIHWNYENTFMQVSIYRIIQYMCEILTVVWYCTDKCFRKTDIKCGWLMNPKTAMQKKISGQKLRNRFHNLNLIIGKCVTLHYQIKMFLSIKVHTDHLTISHTTNSYSGDQVVNKLIQIFVYNLTFLIYRHEPNVCVHLRVLNIWMSS